MFWLTVQFTLGVLLLAKSAEWFARAAGHLAALTRLPRLLMGAILIGLVTNLPEFAVSLSALWKGRPTIALGNAIGSNIANTGLILGLCLIQGRMEFERNWLDRHAIPMLLASVALYALVVWTDVTWWVGVLLLCLCIFYVTWSVSTTKLQELELGTDEVDAESDRESTNARDSVVGTRAFGWAVVGVLLLVSIPLLLVSSHWVLGSAVAIAGALDVSETVIALTLVAAGTSLPELATALAAFRRGHSDTSIGIILGSNIYNALGVIGLSGLFTRLPVSTGNRLFDLPVMLVLFAMLLLPALAGRAPGRRTGYALLGTYAVYTYSLFTVYAIFT